jgi:hypothetical protein
MDFVCERSLNVFMTYTGNFFEYGLILLCLDDLKDMIHDLELIKNNLRFTTNIIHAHICTSMGI